MQQPSVMDKTGPSVEYDTRFYQLLPSPGSTDSAQVGTKSSCPASQLLVRAEIGVACTMSRLAALAAVSGEISMRQIPCVTPTPCAKCVC